MGFILFPILFAAGLLVVALSFFLASTNIMAFLVVFLIGMSFLVLSFIRYILVRRTKLGAEAKIKFNATTAAKPNVRRERFFASFFRRNLQQEHPPIDTSIAKSTPKKVHVVSQRNLDVAILTQATDEKAKMRVFQQYLRKAIRTGYPKEKVKEAALRSGWPHEVFDKAYGELASSYRIKRFILALLLLVAVGVFVRQLYASDVLLFPYLIKTLRHASPIFFIGAIVLLFGVTLIFLLKIRVAMKVKAIEYRIAEQKTVAEIKSKIQLTQGYQTDLDKLYSVLAERGKLSIPEIALIFNISKDQAEEWGKILKDQDLATLHYPTVGEPELLWKQSKSTL